MPRSDFIEVTPVVPISAPAVPVSILPLSVSSAIHVAIATRFTVAMHSPVAFAVITAHTIAVVAMHPPVVTHLTVIGPRLVATGSLIPRLLGVLVRLGGNSVLWACSRSFSFLLGK